MDQLSEIPGTSKKGSALFLDTAWSLVEKECNNYVVTFCEKLDIILGGGIQLGQVTEIAGPAGSGKTQLCYQLAVDVQIPKCLGGVEGEVVYIDTENSFNTNRLKQIAEATADHCTKVAGTAEEKAAASQFTANEIFSKTLCKSCKKIDELLYVANNMEEFIYANNKIKLVVVDSVAFPFRYIEEQALSNLQRCQLQQRLKLALVRVAVHCKVAVVVTNHVTTVFDENQVGKEATALGSNWGTDCATRLFLTSRQGQRFAYVLKSSSKMNSLVPFCVETVGIRDDKTKDIPEPDLREELSQFQISQQMSDFDQTLYDLLPEEEQEEEHIPEPDLGEELSQFEISQQMSDFDEPFYGLLPKEEEKEEHE